MKIIHTPSVYILSKQQIQQEELDRFLKDECVVWSTDTERASEVITETAGRVCYMSYEKPRPGGNTAYLQHIKEVGHGSVLEHAVWTFLFTGVSRSLTHELVRHRAGWAYSQLSQRYVDESVVEVVVPPDLQAEVQAAQEFMAWMDPYMNTSGDDWDDAEYLYYNTYPNADKNAVNIGRIWLNTIEHAYRGYGEVVEYQKEKAERLGLKKTDARKFARQSARSLLPNATETKITCTVNARALRHFFEMRASLFADPEIRNLALEVWRVSVKDSPNLFGDYTPVMTEGSHGGISLSTPYRKV